MECAKHVPRKGGIVIGKLFVLILSLCAASVIMACAAPPAEEPMPASDIEPLATSPAEEQPASPLPVSQSAPPSPLRTPVQSIELIDVIDGVTGEAPQELLDAILDDAASRTGLDRSELTIVQDQAVVWPDGSLGCPEPGMMYTMALVDGYHVIVQADGQLLDYRAGRNNSFRLCENTMPYIRGGTPTR
jgi:hypothetical protein